MYTQTVSCTCNKTGAHRFCSFSYGPRNTTPVPIHNNRRDLQSYCVPDVALRGPLPCFYLPILSSYSRQSG